jgi:hypothetical protein
MCLGPSRVRLKRPRRSERRAAQAVNGHWRVAPAGDGGEGALGKCSPHFPGAPHCQGKSSPTPRRAGSRFARHINSRSVFHVPRCLIEYVLTLPWAVASDCYQIFAGQALRCGFAAQAPGRGEAGRAALALGLF